MTAPRLHIPNPFSAFDPAAILFAFGHVLAAGMQTVAGWVFHELTAALLATTRVDLTGWFAAPWRAMLAVAAVLAVPILLAGVITETLAGRPGTAVRRAVLLPLLVGPVLLATRAVLALLLSLVEGGCALVVDIGAGGPAGFARALAHLGSVVGIGGAGLPGANGAVDLLLLLAATVLSFVVWLELALRAALVYLLAAFVPLALAGLFWSHTARWTRRLLESLAAVILAQLVITVVMVLAAGALAGHGDGLAAGIDRVAVGLALLFLATLGLPMTFRLVPHVVEASVAAGTGAAVAGRIRSQAGAALTAIPTPATRAAGSVLAGRIPSRVTPSAAGPSRPPDPGPASPPPPASAPATAGVDR